MRAAALAVALAVACVHAARAGAFLSQKEAIALAFPDAQRVEARNLVLTDAQAKEIGAAARAPLASKIATVHVGLREGRVIGYALIDVHVVRTQPEALLIVLEPDGAVRSVRAVAFYEPEEYLPPQRFRDAFSGKRTIEELRPEAQIHAIAGATLSSRATFEAVRRAMAICSVLKDQLSAPEEH